MADITLSKAVRSNLLSLQNTATLLGKTQERLATGLKVNSALDNPTNFFTASSLNSRASDLGRLLDSISNANQTLEAADNGLSAITKLVESAQATARQALQAKGQTTTNVVEGSSSATFNPQALTAVAGDNTGVGALTADAAATVDLASLAADAAAVTFDSTDLGDETTTLTSLGIADGDNFTIDIGGTSFTVGFATDTGTITNDVEIDLDTGGAGAGGAAAVSDLSAAINSYLSSNSLGSASSANGIITITGVSTADSIQITDGTQGTNVAELGFGAVGYGADTTDRLATKNSSLDQLVATNGTLNVNFGGSSVGTVTFGTGVGEVNTKQGLIDAIDAFSGVSASGDAGNTGAVTISGTDPDDADSDIVLTANNSTTAGLILGGTDSGSTTVQTTEATNLLSQGFTQGETLDIKVGSGTQLSITFGDSTGQVSTIGELNSALQALAGGAASVDSRGELNVTADSAGDTITIGGSDAALTALGVSAGEASSLIDGTNIAAGDKLTFTVGTNATATITFGTGAGQVNTIDELETALSNIAGATATIDDQTGAITVEATNGSDDIVITSVNSSDVAKASVGAAFGLTAGTFQSTTENSTQRATLETQYNDLLTQINQLAEDASFNGVNLLDSDDLSVIFNEDGSSKLDIDGARFDSTGLGLSRLSSGSFQTDANIDTTLDSLDTAISSLRTQASKFGSNLSVVETRQNFTKEMINTLETGAANLTLADSNEEAANLLALQTRQQLSSTALSLASQSDQQVLRLF
ncbi:MAG: hypothetical protein H6878_11380 [Rhodobiaceae bacterium]|nr:hypothetical protein [Rhodobiaceae bacterium]